MTALLVQSLVLSLLLTLLLEELFALVWGIRGRDLTLVLLVNLLTNPLAVTAHFLLCHLGALPGPPVVFGIETLVVLSEGLLFWSLGKRIPRPWAFALAVNLFSYGTGVLLQAIS